MYKICLLFAVSTTLVSHYLSNDCPHKARILGISVTLIHTSMLTPSFIFSKTAFYSLEWASFTVLWHKTRN